MIPILSNFRANFSRFAESLLSKRWVAIVSVVALVCTCSFILLLITYYPRDNGVKLESLSQITNFKNIQLKNQVAVNNLGLFLLTKEISVGGLDVIDIDEKTTENWAFGSKGVIYLDYPLDIWLKIQANENPDLPKLGVFDNIPNKLNLQDSIDVGFGVSSKPNYKEIVYNYYAISDTDNLRNIAQQIMNFLIKIDTKNQQLYYQNTKNLLQKISLLESKYQNLRNCKAIFLMANQDMQYLVDQNSLGATYISNFNPKKYSNKQIKLINSIASNLKTNNFYITEYLNKQDFNLLKNDFGLNIIYLDSLFNDAENRPNKTKSILEIIDKNMETIQTTANCK